MEERAKTALELTAEETESVGRIAVHPHRPHLEKSFYERFSILGNRVDRVGPGFVVCTFRVPPRLTDRSGSLSPGAIANLVDEVGACIIHRAGQPMNVSVNMSISYLSTAEVDDELEVSSRLLGQKGNIFGTSVVIKKKTTGETVAEGRHMLFCKHTSKI